MGCGSSQVQVQQQQQHANGSAKPTQSYPQQAPVQQQRPPPQPQPPAQVQPPPQQAPPQQPPQPQPPPQEPTPPKPPSPEPPRNPGAPPPQMPEQPKPKTPPPPPELPEQKPAEEGTKDATDGANDGDERAEVRISEDALKQFIEMEMEVRDIERKHIEERLGMSEMQLTNLQSALKNANDHLTMLRQNTEKERQDVVHFNIGQYMLQHNVTMMAPEDALKKEEQEYIDAKNKQDVAEKQVEGLQNQINTVTTELASHRAEVAKLNGLRDRVDGLLENIFNDEYGSELEARLELESEHLLQVKQHISVAHYKWHNSKNLIHHACLQLAFAKRRWEQIKDVASNHIQAKYQMVVEVRAHLIAAHQNIQQTKDYLKTNLFYFNQEDTQNLLISINAIFHQILTVPGYEKALGWYKYYHYRSALLLNWMDQTINNKIITDHKEVSRKYHEKYKELRAERFRCIKQRAKEDLGLDLDMKDLEREDTEERITLDVTTSDSGVAVMVDAATSEGSEADGEDHAPPPIENETNAMEVPDAPAQPEQNESGPPAQQAVPLTELAPPPSSEELFGDITELKETHKQQLAEFEKAQDLNKTRMDQGLQEKLRARRSKRRKQKLHEEQTKELTKDTEEPALVATETTPLGDNGNPAYAEEVLKGDEQNNNVVRNREAAEETIAPPVEEVALGGDGNTAVLEEKPENKRQNFFSKEPEDKRQHLSATIEL